MVEQDSLKARDDRDEPGPAAKLVMVASALALAALLGYMVYQGVTAPSDGHPKPEILSATPTEEGELRVEVAVTNEAERGLREIVLEVDCEEPAPQVTLMNIPAQGRRTGIVHCPGDAAGFTAGIASYVWT